LRPLDLQDVAAIQAAEAARGPVYVLDLQLDPLPRIDLRHRYFEAHRDHPVHGLVRFDTVVHFEGVVEFLPQDRVVREEPLGIHLRGRGALVDFPARLLERGRHFLHDHRIVGRVLYAKVDHRHRAVLVHRNRANFENLPRRLDVRAALDVKHPRDGDDDHHKPHAEGR
jgi:hypothetical protein